jgi:hypothetical protein
VLWIQSQGTYSQYFILFVTYKLAKYVGSFVHGNPLQPNTSLQGQFISYEENEVLWIWYQALDSSNYINYKLACFIKHRCFFQSMESASLCRASIATCKIEIKSQKYWWRHFQIFFLGCEFKICVFLGAYTIKLIYNCNIMVISTTVE